MSEESRLMIDGGKKSKIVTLRVRFPFRDKKRAVATASSTSAPTKNAGKLQRSTVEAASVKTIDQAPYKLPVPYKSIKRVESIQTNRTFNTVLSTMPPTAQSSLVDRYLAYETQEHTIEHSLQSIELRLRDISAVISKAHAELEGQRREGTRLKRHRNMVSGNKRKAWDAMSKDESRELGRREAKAKRQKRT